MHVSFRYRPSDVTIHVFVNHDIIPQKAIGILKVEAGDWKGLFRTDAFTGSCQTDSYPWKRLGESQGVSRFSCSTQRPSTWEGRRSIHIQPRSESTSTWTWRTQRLRSTMRNKVSFTRKTLTIYGFNWKLLSRCWNSQRAQIPSRHTDCTTY